MKRLTAGTLSKKALSLFVKNWAAYTIEINTLEATTYHKHIHFFRKHRDLMAAMARKLADELVHPKPPIRIRGQVLQSHIVAMQDTTPSRPHHHGLCPEAKTHLPCRFPRNWYMRCKTVHAEFVGSRSATMEFSSNLEYEWTFFKGNVFRERKEAVPRSDIDGGDLRTGHDAVLSVQCSNTPTRRAKYAYMSLLGDSFIPHTSMLYF